MEQPSLFKKASATVGVVPLKDIAPWHSGARSASSAAIRTLGFASTVLLRAFAEPKNFSYTDDEGNTVTGAFRFEVIDGARRLDDAKHEGLERIPATILPPETSELEAAAHRISANLSRRPNPSHEAEALRRLYEAYRQQGVTEDDIPSAIARTLGVSASVVKQRLKLTELPEMLRGAVAEGKVAASVASRIANLSKKQQQELLRRYQHEGKLTAGSVEEVRRVQREVQLAELGTALFEFDEIPKAIDVFKQAIRRALAEGLEPEALIAAVREEVTRERT